MKRVAVLVLALSVSGCTIGQDKYWHALGGAVVGGGSRAFGLTREQSCGLSIAVGIANEVRDAQGFGNPDPKDAIATGLAGCLFSYYVEF